MERPNHQSKPTLKLMVNFEISWAFPDSWIWSISLLCTDPPRRLCNIGRKPCSSLKILVRKLQFWNRWHKCCSSWNDPLMPSGPLIVWRTNMVHLKITPLKRNIIFHTPPSFLGSILVAGVFCWISSPLWLSSRTAEQAVQCRWLPWRSTTVDPEGNEGINWIYPPPGPQGCNRLVAKESVGLGWGYNPIPKMFRLHPGAPGGLNFQSFFTTYPRFRIASAYLKAHTVYFACKLKKTMLADHAFQQLPHRQRFFFWFQSFSPGKLRHFVSVMDVPFFGAGSTVCDLAIWLIERLETGQTLDKGGHFLWNGAHHPKMMFFSEMQKINMQSIHQNYLHILYINTITV